jgi:tetratricopeptide (TPR) repeat protein
VRFLAARLRRQLGQPEEAARLLDQFLAVVPYHVPALVERGRVALDLAHPDQAERWLLQALQIQAGRDVYLALSDCMRQAERPDEAKRYQDRVKEIDARLAKVMSELNRKSMGSDGTPPDPAP